MTLSIEEFGKALLLSGDLDPVYLAINNAKLPTHQMNRLCLSYWCFYHLGAAARMAEAQNEKKFWDMMTEAAKYSPVAHPNAQPWPRGSERRHYRGLQAITSMKELTDRYRSAGQAVIGMIGGFGQPKLTYKSVASNVMRHRGFGEWIAFKIADMTERVLAFPVDFSDCALGIYKDPRQGAAVAAYFMRPQDDDLRAIMHISGDEYLDPWDYPITDSELKKTVDMYVKHFSKIKNVPGLDRPVNVQEVETIFCKYKSHLKGHYPLGKDTKEIRHALEGWGDLAQELSKGLPA